MHGVFYFISMMKWINVVISSSFVVRIVKFVLLAWKATGAPLVACMAESPRGSTCPEAWLGS
jgi:hypothetical protein